MPFPGLLAFRDNVIDGRLDFFIRAIHAQAFRRHQAIVEAIDRAFIQHVDALRDARSPLLGVAQHGRIVRAGAMAREAIRLVNRRRIPRFATAGTSNTGNAPGSFTREQLERI